MRKPNKDQAFNPCPPPPAGRGIPRVAGSDRSPVVRGPGASLIQGPAAPVALLTLFWLAMIVLVDPRGDFPLNDDWACARAVETLAREGVLRIPGWLSMSAVAEILWGWLFRSIFGASFAVLRASTLTLSLAGVLATYGALREGSVRRWVAFAAAAGLAANPIYLVMSCTFMTDVPFCAFAAVALLFFVRCLRRPTTPDLVLGILFATIATLTRQFGLVLPLAFGAAHLIRRPWRTGRLVTAAVPAVVSGGVLLIYQKWLAATAGLPLAYRSPGARIQMFLSYGAREIVIYTLWSIVVLLVYSGLYALPVLPFVRLPRRGALRWALPGWLAASVVITGYMAKIDWLMPITGNILWESGLGPGTLRDVYIDTLPHLPVLPRSLWFIMTFFAIAGGGLLIGWTTASVARSVRRLRRLRPGAGDRLAVFSILVIVLYAGLFVLGELFDRYLLFVYPVFAFLLLRGARPPRSSPRLMSALALCLLFALFGVAGTHDYLAWNRARWALLGDLVGTRKIAPSRIDGGFEFNAVHLYRDGYSAPPGKSWWWVQDDEYVLAFGPMDGYLVESERSYGRWLPPGEGRVLILHRTAGGVAVPPPARYRNP